MNSRIHEIYDELAHLGRPERVPNTLKFFKVFPGGYGEGDEFLAISVPNTRKVAKKYRDLTLNEILIILHNPIHEHRLFALFAMVDQFNLKKYHDRRESLIQIYLENTEYINNWDLVDTSAYKLLGAYLIDKKKDVLYNFANSGDLWKQRIAIIATLWFIRQKKYVDTLKIAEILLDHSHDLIHKAVGWMIREVGNRDKQTEVLFLKKYYQKMPRTMLRYAIEKFPEEERQLYLKGKI